MKVKKIYWEDLEIAKALIRRDEKTTREVFYRKYYPLFKSIYDNYYTDCTCCKEFIDVIYLVVLAPSENTGKCQMENFRGESSLPQWLKSACLYHCYNKYELKNRMPKWEPLPDGDENRKGNDIFNTICNSIELDFTSLNRQDVLVILKQMPCKRYSELIRLRYLEEKTNEETAEILGMTMNIYYNKHKLAKEQFLKTLRKEDNL